jgi:hypothetical protein
MVLHLKSPSNRSSFGVYFLEILHGRACQYESYFTMHQRQGPAARASPGAPNTSTLRTLHEAFQLGTHAGVPTMCRGVLNTLCSPVAMGFPCSTFRQIFASTSDVLNMKRSSSNTDLGAYHDMK